MMDELNLHTEMAREAARPALEVSSVRPVFARLGPVKKLSYGPSNTGNFLVHGENVSVMKSMNAWLSGRVKCAYLDPPYRTGERFTHYDDDATHEEWLRDVTARVRHVWELLAEDGSVWISIDDREVHYLKVALDRVVGRENFITTIIWQQRTTRENRKVFSNNHEYLLVYAKNPRRFSRTRNGLALTDDIRGRYVNHDNDPRGLWQSVSANVQAGHAVASQFYTITAPNGRKHVPPNGRCWVYNQCRMELEIAQGNVWFGKDGNGVPRLKKFLSSGGRGVTPETLWFADDVGTNDHAKKHIHAMFPGDPPFDTPKPEALILRVLHIGSDPGDLVFDPYLGSGTTSAVAMKIGRRFVGIESGEHAASIAAARMKMVIDGECGGISKDVDWQGGGGFDFLRYR
ncbi:type III restriction-modification system methyltransferase [Bordetella ansorpii]|uniref:Methyltransferase n=1 Tax=Bordetella ansorpii TaxID=288768 RepID=A0A157L4Q9_9BORD|nr:site-specific DNA-methyltransferase [Bordetella ansorpii]SAH91630.1 type III restriction-modification system methyltransferase [Bordetella ansorpii]